MRAADFCDPLLGKLLAVHEAAALLGVSPSTVRNLFRRGLLRGFRAGNTVRLLAADVRRMARCAK